MKRKKQYEALEGKLPEAVVACIGGGSNAMGMFYPFVHDEEVALYGVEAAGKRSSYRKACSYFNERKRWRSPRIDDVSSAK
ncbi:hypothetical protein ACT7DO_24690 [Bacillus pacificus]